MVSSYRLRQYQFQHCDLKEVQKKADVSQERLLTMTMRIQQSSQGEIILEDQLSAVKHKNKHTFGGPTTKQYAPKHFIFSCQLEDEFQEEHLSNAHIAKERILRLTCAKIQTFDATDA